MRLIKSAGVAATVGLLYPRMLPIHTFEEDVGFRGENGRIKLPPLMRISYARMEPNGAYLIGASFLHTSEIEADDRRIETENGEIAILWLGSSVSPQILQDLYAVENLDELDTRMASLPALPTRLSTQLRNVLSYYALQRGGKKLPVLIARQNIDGTEVEFSNMLVEDANKSVFFFSSFSIVPLTRRRHSEQLSYIDYLCSIHSQIQADLLGESKKGDFDAASTFTNW